MVLLLGWLAACTGSASEVGELPEPFTHATAMEDCAPWDGAAVSVLLTTQPIDSSWQVRLPSLRLSIWRDLAAVENGVFTWPADEQVGVASWCETENDCESARAGRVRFHGMAPDSLLTGEFDLSFAGRGQVKGGFKAAWRHHQMMCG